MATKRSSSSTFEAEVVRCVRTITRLQTQARRLRRQLKAVQANLRVERRHLRAIQVAMENRDPDIVPLHAFGGVVGFKREPL